MAKKKNETTVESENMWNYDASVAHAPQVNRRTIVSVAMPSEEFELVSEAARASAMKLSEFIRNAAVEKARLARRVLHAPAITLSLTNSAVFEPYSTDTQVYGLAPNSLLLEV